MKKIKVFVFALVAGMLLVSCGGKSTKEKTSEESEVSVSETSGDDYDKMLDDYEAFVDQVVPLYKKVLAGDQSAMDKYTSLVEKSESLEKSLKNVGNTKTLTPQQTERLLKIEKKMLESMQ